MRVREPMDERKDVGTDDTDLAQPNEDASALNIASCTCFDFNPSMEHVFLVGTEYGHVMQCSTNAGDKDPIIYRVKRPSLSLSLWHIQRYIGPYYEYLCRPLEPFPSSNFPYVQRGLDS